MEKIGNSSSHIFEKLVSFLRKCLFKIVSVGPIPEHIAFIMDGNRRYAKKLNSAVGAGHKAGYSSLMSMLVYCYELGVKYVTVYAFSIDNFKRKPEEVQYLMDLMLEKIEGLLEQESIVNRYGIRLYFIGNLNLLNEKVRLAAEKAMKATGKNDKVFLLVCVAYTSSDEIVRAVEESCKTKSHEMRGVLGSKVKNGNLVEGFWNGEPENSLFDDPEAKTTTKLGSCKSKSDEMQRLFGSKVDNGESYDREVWNLVERSRKNGPENDLVDDPETRRLLGSNVCNGESFCHEIGNLVGENSLVDGLETRAIKLTDIEKHMYMAVSPDPDIVIRSSGEMRLSNFLLWQTATCPLYSPAALWPELGLWHLVWAVLNFQRSYEYLEKKRKKS